MLFGSERKHFSGPVRFSRTSRETLSSALHPQHPRVVEVPKDGQMSALEWCLISATVGLGDSVPRKNGTYSLHEIAGNGILNFANQFSKIKPVDLAGLAKSRDVPLAMPCSRFLRLD